MEYFGNLLCVLMLFAPRNATGNMQRFYSDENAFMKLVDPAKHNYTYWNQKCSDLGGGWRSVIIDSQTKYEFVEQKHGGLSDDSSCWIGGSTDTEDEKFVPFFRYIASSTEIGVGWVPAVINSQTEYDFISAQQRGLSNNNNYWIGGSTNAIPGTEVPFDEYDPQPDSPIHVFVSTERNGRRSNRRFQLRGEDSSLLLFGVLCEKQVGGNNAGGNDSGGNNV